ncbi:hypothetical protein [Paenibacillus methanolicus]|uniref:Uncharacterized protein n=1 Tax=Paenibacillus methanolicus TaxID=582686 RepID=A0A5S5C5T1_9BACL|nr:hypothetical protein [Paenibacillus methanolicus]TYP74677.1 hypothetical protein BCM02_105221 [Paenibacillus methanolicus]
MLKRMPFERPTDHYDEKLLPIDEQLCALLKQRKALSGGNPGYPPIEYVERWATDNGLQEEFVKVLFGTLMNEDIFKPVVEPEGFRAYIPVLQSFEQDGFFYTLNAVRQYNNASIVTLAIDWDTMSDDMPNHMSARGLYELNAGEDYECRMTEGGSSSGHGSYNFVVWPPLPDDLAGMTFVFTPIGRPRECDTERKRLVFDVK